MSPTPLSWLGIVRLGLVQTAIGAIVVLMTSTLNRVMVIELALPAVLPGALVAFHYAIQTLRPHLGHGSDTTGRRTPWIVGGMAVLALGATGASLATALMAHSGAAGIALAVLAFALVGLGVGAAGTSLLALLASRVAPRRRAPAATIVWLMMIAGFVVTATTAGHQLDPFTPARLVVVTAVVGALAFAVTVVAVLGIERGERTGAVAAASTHRAPGAAPVGFRAALGEVWGEREARRFAIFVFVAMLAYSAQDLILEPFAGLLLGMTPGETTRLSGLQNTGVLVGMILVAVMAGAGRPGAGRGSLAGWTILGCIASAIALASLALAALGAGFVPLQASIVALGFANGAFAVAAIGSMMALAGAGRGGAEGVRMGVFGAAQALAFGLGGLLGTASVDLARLALGSPLAAYGTVFAVEALLFVAAAVLAARVVGPAAAPAPRPAFAPHPA